MCLSLSFPLVSFFILTRSLADGLRLFLTAIVLQEMSGLSLFWAVVLVGLTTVVYTFFGGMKAVVWTDVVQLVVYLVGAGAALALLLDRLPGGWEQLLAVAASYWSWRRKLATSLARQAERQTSPSLCSRSSSLWMRGR